MINGCIVIDDGHIQQDMECLQDERTILAQVHMTWQITNN